MKTQTIRLLDVFFIGPVMIYGGRKLAEREPWVGHTLTVLGIATIIYNGKNYLDLR